MKQSPLIQQEFVSKKQKHESIDIFKNYVT